MVRGFRISETMSGWYEDPIDGRREKFEFELEWGTDDISGLVGRGFPMMLVVYDGHVKAEGLYRGPIDRGSFMIDYPRNTIEYYFEFGKYNYEGMKLDIKLWNLPFSHTTCFGTICNDECELVSATLTKFKFRTLPKMLSTLRLT